MYWTDPSNPCEPEASRVRSGWLCALVETGRVKCTFVAESRAAAVATASRCLSSTVLSKLSLKLHISIAEIRTCYSANQTLFQHNPKFLLGPAPSTTIRKESTTCTQSGTCRGFIFSEFNTRSSTYVHAVTTLT